MKSKSRSTSFNAQRGIMLLESLIAILVFSLGILAMVGMQAVSIAHTSQAKYRADASFAANKLIAQMWVDSDANMPLYATGGASFTNWLTNEVQANLTGGRTNATVTVTPFDASAVVGVAAAPLVKGFVIDISIQWRAPNEADSAPRPCIRYAHADHSQCGARSSSSRMSHIGFHMHNYKKARGFSLVEMMVAVVIGLIGTVVIFQVFAVSEGHKRSTVSGGDAQQNGAIALFSMERELRNAGNGLTQLIARGAPIYGWNNVTGAARPALVIRPLTITAGATSDTIDINYATFGGLTAPVKVTSSLGSWDPTSVAAGNILSVASVVGFNNGDKIVVCPSVPDPAGPAPGPTGDTCIIAEITDLGADDRIFVEPPPTEFTVFDSALDTSKFNPAAGFGVLNPTLALDGRALPATYSAGTGAIKDALVYNLGNSLVGKRYAVDVANSLMTIDDGSGAGPQEFADGVIAIRAQYGLDTDADRVVDVWVNPKSVPANALADNTPDHPSCVTTTTAGIADCWRRVQAVRTAIVTRSGVFEKAEVETRSSIPLWTNPTANPVPGPSFAVAAGDARHYRYKVFETIVPLRNMIWQVHRADTTGD